MTHIVRFILDTAGIGGLILAGVLGTATLAYILLTRWILLGGKEPEPRISRGYQLPEAEERLNRFRPR